MLFEPRPDLRIAFVRIIFQQFMRLKKWLNLKEIHWEYHEQDKEMQQSLLQLLKIRKGYFKGLVIAFIPIYFETFISFIGRSLRFKSEFSELPYFLETSISIGILTYILTIWGIYKVRLKPIQQDLASKKIVKFDVVITRKQNYPGANKYFLFSDTYPYHQFEVSQDAFNGIQEGTLWTILIAEKSKYRFTEFERFELI